MESYIVVTWPEIQYYMTLPGFDENSYLINDERGIENFGSSAYFINRIWYFLCQNAIDKKKKTLKYFKAKETLDKIITIICNKAKISEEDLKGKSKKRKIVELRKIYCKLAKDRGFSLNHIGRAINRHHAAMCYLIKQFYNDIANPSFELKYDVMCNLLKDNKI